MAIKNSGYQLIPRSLNTNYNSGNKSKTPNKHKSKLSRDLLVQINNDNGILGVINDLEFAVENPAKLYEIEESTAGKNNESQSPLKTPSKSSLNPFTEHNNVSTKPVNADNSFKLSNENLPAISHKKSEDKFKEASLSNHDDQSAKIHRTSWPDLSTELLKARALKVVNTDKSNNTIKYKDNDDNSNVYSLTYEEYQRYIGRISVLPG